MFIVGTALAVRLLGIILDGTLAESLRVVGAETVLLILSLAAYSGERLMNNNPVNPRS